MPKIATVAAENFRRRTEVAAELRGIAAKAVAEGRNYTPAEEGRIAELEAEQSVADSRVSGALSALEAGRAEPLSVDDVRGALDHGQGTGWGRALDTGPSAEAGTRAVGNLRAWNFDRDDLRKLHADVHSARGGQIQASAGTDVPMSTFPTQYLPPAEFRREPTRVAALMPAQSVEAASVTAYQTSTAASAADTVAEGDEKPESSPRWTALDVPIRKIAHYTDVTKESLDDFVNFAQIVQAEMIAGVIGAENAQVLSGSGVAPDIKGLLGTSGILTVAPSTAQDPILSVLAAITSLRTGAAFCEPDAVVLHPTDWMTIQSTAASDGSFIANATPLAASPLSVWGVPVVLSTGLTAGTALVGCFADAAIVFQREAPSITIDPFSQSSSNLVRVIAEERLGLGVIRPAALCKVTFNTDDNA